MRIARQPCLAALFGCALLLALSTRLRAQEAPDNKPDATADTAATSSPTTQPASTQLTPLAPEEASLASGLIGSKHDFTKGGVEGRNLCLPCHTPHLAQAPAPKLDKRPRSTPPLQGYTSADLELDAWSLLCLGCHDGVTAPDVFSGAHAVTVGGQISAYPLRTARVRNHPVGVRYPLNERYYAQPAAVEAAGLPLPDGRVQCVTCHDAHNTHRYDGMLQISNNRSRLCLTCHQFQN